MKIEWKGHIFDPSGYGNATRDYVKALYENGCDISVNVVNNAQDPKLYGGTGSLMESLAGKDIDPDIVIHHYVPNKLDNLVDKNNNVFNVGFNTWETDKIPGHWVDNLNYYFDLVLVPSHFNKSVYENCGVTTPIEVVPHCLPIQEYEKAPDYNADYDTGFLGDRYKFFSVFQWTERKNPINLLKAYFSAFYNNQNDKVLLMLKTFRSNDSYEEKKKIVDQITQLKRDMNFDKDKCPPLILLTTFLPKQDIITLYKMCDCFVFPTRAEGFGLPIMEAMLCNKPVITTNYGGHLDFCCEDYKGSNYFTSNAFNKPLCTLLPYQLTPVAHMQWIPYYDGTQSWAEPDVMNIKEHMRYVYYGMYLHDTAKAQKHIEKNYNYKTIAQRIVEILNKYKRC